MGNEETGLLTSREETRNVTAPVTDLFCLLPRPISRIAATHEAVPGLNHLGGFAYFTVRINRLMAVSAAGVNRSSNGWTRFATGQAPY